MSAVKYTVRYNGRIIPLAAFAKEHELPYDTLRHRARNNSEVFAPLKVPKSQRDVFRQRCSVYLDGYSFDELLDLYGHFRGRQDELQILMDFTGLTHREAQKLLEELKMASDERRRAI